MSNLVTPTREPTEQGAQLQYDLSTRVSCKCLAELQHKNRLCSHEIIVVLANFCPLNSSSSLTATTEPPQVRYSRSLIIKISPALDGRDWVAPPKPAASHRRKGHSPLQAPPILTHRIRKHGDPRRIILVWQKAWVRPAIRPVRRLARILNQIRWEAMLTHLSRHW